MSKKLTLTMNDSVIGKAKRYSRKKRVSLSKLVENYFSSITSAIHEKGAPLPPITSQLVGMFAGKKVDKEREAVESALLKKYL